MNEMTSTITAQKEIADEIVSKTCAGTVRIGCRNHRGLDLSRTYELMVDPQLNAFVRGVTAVATGAIAGAVIVLARRSIYDVPTFAIAIVSLGVLFRWKIPEPVVIGCAAMAGLLLRPA